MISNFVFHCISGSAGAAASNVVKADSKPKAKPAEVKPAEVKPESEDDEDSSDEEDESADDDDSEKGVSFCNPVYEFGFYFRYYVYTCVQVLTRVINSLVMIFVDGC